MSISPITVTTHDNGRTEIVFSRPELLNRVDDDLRDALINALRSVRNDGSTHCIVLGAEGTVFSAGGYMEMLKTKHGDIAALPPQAVQGTKRSLNHVMRLRAHEVLELSFAYEAETMSSQDFLEGIAAFQEKRAPKYSGH